MTYTISDEVRARALAEQDELRRLRRFMEREARRIWGQNEQEEGTARQRCPSEVPS